MAKTINIVIHRDRAKGVEVSVDGVKGPACKALTAALEARLGGEQHTQEKPAYFEQEPLRERERNRE